MSDFDSPWKDALDRWFPAFLAFFFPDIHADIDWSRGYEMLDKELQQIVREAEVGRRHVDTLAKVWRRTGEETWVLIHVEIQSQPNDEFAERMFVYFYRLFDRYKRRIASLAVLADEKLDWRPHRYECGLWGCMAGIVFRIVKLLDQTADEAALEANPNPFAVIALAHVKTQQTRADAVGRKVWKLRLVRGLYERGLNKVDIVELFRFIDWVMDLPEPLGIEFDQELHRFAKEKQMPFISPFERRAIERGLAKGLEQGRELGLEQGREQGREEGLRNGILSALAVSLEAKFGARGKRLMTRVRQVEDRTALEALLPLVVKSSSLDEVKKALP